MIPRNKGKRAMPETDLRTRIKKKKKLIKSRFYIRRATVV